MYVALGPMDVEVQTLSAATTGMKLDIIAVARKQRVEMKDCGKPVFILLGLRYPGIDHPRLSFKSQGLDLRMTGVKEHYPVKGILA